MRVSFSSPIQTPDYRYEASDPLASPLFRLAQVARNRRVPVYCWLSVNYDATVSGLTNRPSRPRPSELKQRRHGIGFCGASYRVCVLKGTERPTNQAASITKKLTKSFLPRFRPSPGTRHTQRPPAKRRRDSSSPRSTLQIQAESAKFVVSRFSV